MFSISHNYFLRFSNVTKPRKKVFFFFKLLWEKEKIPVLIALSFPHNIFYPFRGNYVNAATFKGPCSVNRGFNASAKRIDLGQPERADLSNFYTLQNEGFRGYTGIRLSVRPCMCSSAYKILGSVKALAGVLSHI